MFNEKSILVTGGTGSFGKKFCEWVLKKYKPERLIVYSRDEHKQAEMMCDPRFQSPCMRFFIGDVRDMERLNRAMNGVDIAVHSAALKHVPAAEYNPHEFIKTNINGATNLVEAALNSEVDKVIALSTDKAVNPMNLYGATKLCADKIFVAANSYRGKQRTKFSVMRYGNVLGSRGSVVPRFITGREEGVLNLTHPDMTRFYIKLDDCIRFIFKCIEKMQGGELFIPKLGSCSLKDLAEAIAPEAEHRVMGLRPGEKMHELLISEDEAHLTLEYDNYYLMQPALPFWEHKLCEKGGRPCTDGFVYSSQNNEHRLSIGELRELCAEFEHSMDRELATC